MVSLSALEGGETEKKVDNCLKEERGEWTGQTLGNVFAKQRCGFDLTQIVF